ncbi:Hypothetical predicted protein [Olea europaea subsp. europaea]|uniref:Uncharacterized protein n=1 Tax=Olea europaea subsp. europaea TaxID=158383 RepID=A0A8S0QN37_OLEEU|nr:Hypothetical predicted protein [Olea europaea subsp. europaea]
MDMRRLQKANREFGRRETEAEAEAEASKLKAKASFASEVIEASKKIALIALEATNKDKAELKAKVDELIVEAVACTNKESHMMKSSRGLPSYTLARLGYNKGRVHPRRALHFYQWRQTTCRAE